MYLNCVVDLTLFFDASETILPFHIQMDTSPFLDSNCFNFSLCKHDEDMKDIWESNKRTINLGTPLIIGVDRYYLPYHRHYQKLHGAHAVFLCGYDEIQHQVFLLDSDRNGIYRGAVDINVINQARLSENSWNGNINSGGNIKGASLEIILNEFHDSPEVLLRRTVKNMLVSYFENILDHSQTLTGCTAMQYIYQWYTGQKKPEESERGQYFMDLYAILLPVYAKKTLFLNYLKDAITLCHTIPSMEVALTCAKQCVDLWKTFYQVLLKLAHRKVFSNVLYQDSITLFKKSIARENELGFYLDEMNRQLR